MRDFLLTGGAIALAAIFAHQLPIAMDKVIVAQDAERMDRINDCIEQAYMPRGCYKLVAPQQPATGQ